MRRTRLAAGLGALAVAAGLAGGVVLLQGERAPERAAVAPPPAVGTTIGATAAPPVEPVPVAEPVRDPAAAGQAPGTVRLPGGGTARLVRKEVSADGTLPIPDGLDEATWWGATLGADRGVALLSGHVNWAGQTGPFAELWRTAPGAEVTVVDEGGGRWVYRVAEVLTVHKNELPGQAQRLFGQDGPHRLVLVTCGGDYVGGTDGYVDNRIVTAELVTRP
ncbi:class F sortase [Saccharomonospora sp. NPDC046836]|uniref:class F sortase n=1 Tax=Saccharomonospora sp. NPDC046836 TaxID=3156921 RepID=UPI0033CC5531